MMVCTRAFGFAGREIPAIFVKSDDGAESLLNFTVEGPDVVIHRLARHFVLRRGKLTGCVTNRGFIGSGERLDSGHRVPASSPPDAGDRPMSLFGVIPLKSRRPTPVPMAKARLMKPTDRTRTPAKCRESGESRVSIGCAPCNRE